MAERFPVFMELCIHGAHALGPSADDTGSGPTGPARSDYDSNSDNCLAAAAQRTAATDMPLATPAVEVMGTLKTLSRQPGMGKRG